MIVADASAIGAFIIPDEAGPFADFARQMCVENQIHVPAHWHVEVANLIRKASRRGRLRDAEAEDACTAAVGLSEVAIVAPPVSIELAITTSERLGLTAYDAAYFLLARSLRIPLLTDDGALRRVAIEQGLRVLAP